MSIELNGKQVDFANKQTVLEFLDEAGVYLPRLCAFPGLKNDADCNMCVAEINGRLELACKIEVTDGMIVNTEAKSAVDARKKAFGKILSHHPHICLVCDQKEGCDRLTCTYAIPVQERCCNLFEVCEIRKLTDYIGIDKSTSKFTNPGYEIIRNRLFFYNPNLCVGCERCVRICEAIPKANVWLMKDAGDRRIASIKAENFKDSGCVFCGACVLVCPAGAINVNEGKASATWIKRAEEKLSLKKQSLPPVKSLELTAGNVENIPEGSGVYILYNQTGEIIKIKGEMNLKDALKDEIGNAERFSYEMSELYSSRENEMLSGFMKRYGRMPGGDDMDELF